MLYILSIGRAARIAGLAAAMLGGGMAIAAADQYADCLLGCEALSLAGEQLSTCKSLCETAMHFEAGTLAACEQLKGALRDGCLANVAVEQGEPAYCAFVASRTIAAACYTSVAVKLGDKSLCENIAEAVFKASCTGKFE
jgi:hypothetical protein